VVPWSIARIIGGTLSGPASHCPPDVSQLASAVEEARRGPAGRTVAQRQLDLLDPVSSSDRVDRHAYLDPPAAGERDQLAQRRDPHPPLAGERRLQTCPAESLDGPTGVADGEAESPTLRVRETSPPRRRTSPPQTASTSGPSSPALSPRSASQSSTVASSANSPTAASAAAVTFPPLPCGAPSADQPGAVAHGLLLGAVGGGVVGDHQAGCGKGSCQGVKGRADPLHLVLRRDDHDARRFRRHG